MILVTNKNNHIKTVSKELSILVSLYGLSFMINDATNELKKFFEYNFEPQSPDNLTVKLQEIEKERQLDFQKFNQINLIHHNSFNTLVPEAFFDKKQVGLFLRQNIKLLSNDPILSDAIPFFQLHNIYVPYRSVTDYFSTHPNLSNQHSVSLFLQNIEQIKKTEKHLPVNEIYINIFANDFQIAIFNNEKLLLFNQFEFKTVDEFLYYIFFILETLDIKEKNSFFYITGVKKNNDLISNLNDFTGNLRVFPEKNPGNINNYILNAN